MNAATNAVKANPNAVKTNQNSKGKTTMIKANPNASKAAAPAAAPVKAQPVKANREVSNKVKPQGTDPAVVNAKPTTAPNAAAAVTLPTITISTGNDKADKKYKVGDPSILPQEYAGKSAADQLKEAYISEEKGLLGWKQLANYYGWSLEPIKKAMIATNDWPMVVKKDKKGKEVKRPQGYKAIYNEEKDAGLPGLGYWLNRAANRFAEYKPAELRSNPTATVKPGDKKYIGGSNPRKDKKSNFDIACDIIAGMKPETIKKLVANEYVNDAMREVLDKKYQKPLKG